MILVEYRVLSPFARRSPIWAKRGVLTWSSAWWTWAAAVATWSSRSASSVSSVPLWMQRAASSSSFSWPSSPYTVPAARYTCRGGTALSSALQTQDQSKRPEGSSFTLCPCFPGTRRESVGWHRHRLDRRSQLRWWRRQDNDGDDDDNDAYLLSQVLNQGLCATYLMLMA